MQKGKLHLALAAAGLATVLLSACGGGGGGSASSGSTTPATATMSATPALGQLRNSSTSSVKVTLYKDGVKYKDGTWDSTTGTATFSGLTGTETNLVVEVEGGEYYNEATGLYVANSGKMRAVADKVYANGIAVTPLTHVAAQRLLDVGSDGIPRMKSGKTSTDILTENFVEGARWGIVNPLLPPALVDHDTKVASTATPEAQKYAVILAAMAVAAQSADSTPVEMMNDLAKDLADGTLDGLDAGAAIADLSYTVNALTTSYATTVNTAVTAIADDSNTALAAIAPTSVDLTVNASDVQSSVTAVTSAGDSITQAKTLVSSLRSGVLPYFSALGTGYIQTTKDDIDASFGVLQSSVYGADDAINAINLATQIVGKKIGDPAAVISPLTFSTNDLFCFDDKNSVTQGLYPAGTTFAAGCRYKAKIPVAGNPDQFDHVTYNVYTDKPALSTTSELNLNESATFKWTGRIDRYQYNDLTHTSWTRVIKGVNPQTGLEDANARRLGNVSVAVAYNETVSTTGTGYTYTFSLGPITLKGDLWPVVANTDKATIDITATAQANGLATENLVNSTVAGTDTASLKLSGSLVALSGTAEVARLTFAPSAGTSENMLSGSSSFQYEMYGPGYTDTLTAATLDAQVTLATAKYEVSGIVKVSELDSNVTLPKKLHFGGKIKDRTNNFDIFAGTFDVVADYANYNPFIPDSATNYVTGTATLVGLIKKAATDLGLQVTLVGTRLANSAAETYALTYKDNNKNLTVNAAWNEAARTGEITNTTSAGIKVVLDDNDPTKDGNIMSGTTKIGQIRNGVVTYADGYSESLI